MKVAYILQDFPRWSETFILREMCELRRRGHDLAVFALDNPREPIAHEAAAEITQHVTYAGALGPRAKLAAIAYYLRTRPAHLCSAVAALCADAAAHPRWFLPSWRRIPTALAFARRVEQRGVRHVHAHFAYIPADVARVIAAVTGANVTVSAHAWDIHAQPAGILRRRLRGVAEIAACSADGQNVLRQKLGDGHRVTLVHHGLPLEPFRQGDSQTRPPLLLGVGRMTEKKGFDDLVAACRALRDKGARFECRIVGDGPTRAALTRLVSEDALVDIVRLDAPMPQDDLRRLFAGASVFVHPARQTAAGDREGIPNVVLEAMASGLPVVATRSGGIPEVVVDGLTGMLVAPGDADAMAAAIDDLLASPETAHRLGAAGHRHVCEHYDIVRNVDELERFFEESNAGHGD